MKKIFMEGLILVLVILFAAGCQKPEVTCSNRLTTYDYYDAIGNVHNIEHFSYKDGLLDVVTTFYGFRFNMEYNAQKKLIGSRAYEGEMPIYIINFVYKNGKIIEEIWRHASSQEVYDHVFLTYNDKGNLLRNESFILDYSADYTYTPNGSLKSWKIIDHGLNIAKAEYTYEANYKNPFTSIKGVVHQFWYTNSGFAIGSGPRWYSSEKVTLYNESNEPYTYYDQDPLKTVWHDGPQNYPLQSEYVDKGTGAQIKNTFEYDCIFGMSPQAGRTNQKITFENTRGDKKNKAYFMLPLNHAIKKFKKLQLH